MSRFIVDGMNVIGSKPDGWWRDRPAAQRALVEQLWTFAASNGADITVVFDGRPHEVDAPAGIDVVFASRSGPNAADDDIARLVEDDPAPHDLTVVTSDSDLAARVRQAGADTLGARGFATCSAERCA
jgi:predicted RNA-binding protein with PIN domain